MSEEDGIEILERHLDPDKVKLTFTKQRRDGDENTLPDGYLDAYFSEIGDGEDAIEHLNLVLTLAQAQGWADTLGAQLHDYRSHQMRDGLADVDEIYVVRPTNGYVDPTLEKVALTRKAAYGYKRDLEHEHPLEEFEIDTVEILIDT